MNNYFDNNKRKLNGFWSSQLHNFFFLTALKLTAKAHPGDNRARLVTALLCATTTGLSSGIIIGRKLNNANMVAYSTLSALAMLALQAVFESIRFPIYGKIYNRAGELFGND